MCDYVNVVRLQSQVQQSHIDWSSQHGSESATLQAAGSCQRGSESATVQAAGFCQRGSVSTAVQAAGS